MRAWIRRFRRRRSGSVSVEFALLASVLLTLSAGTVEFGRCLQMYRAVNRIATQYAIVWADCVDTPTGTCNTELAAYASQNTLSNIAAELTTASISVRMLQVYMSGATPTVTYSYPTGASLTTAERTIATGLLADTQSGVIVTGSYTHTVSFFPHVMGALLAPLLTPSFTVAQMK